MKCSVSEENYIKTIYHLQRNGTAVSTTAVATELHTKPASVTDMLKKLKAKNLLNYERYYGFTLSAEGTKLALGIIRKHRLWEYFLVTELQFGWEEVHPIAEELEHISSTLLIEKLDRYLRYPKYDPHGDPIPDADGMMEITKQINLVELQPGCEAEVSAVGSQSTELLDLLKHKNIGLGTVLKVLQRFSFDNSLEVKMQNLPPFSISHQLAQTIFLKPIYGPTTVGSLTE